ncbi:Rne/Rng family ribonuclease [Marinicella litoralis]
MLINATHTDEIRVAIADGQKLYDLDIDSAGHYRKKGNIYKAKITRVEPSLEACFVNYGSERHGFLPYKEISPAYCKQAPRGKARLPINEALREGDEIIVQVNKEERGNKGAALSTFISLAGRYLVYMPGNHRAGGISRQIRGEKRNQLQDIMRRLEIPKNDGVIIRTAGLGTTFEELQWDFNYLKQVWEAIGTAAEQKKGPFFIYQESDLFIRALRDYLQPDIGEILIDDRDSYEKAREFMQQVMPHNLKKLSYYNDTTPLFSRYQIERQIQSAFEREVKLPSGGSLVIDQTEALLSIDINSAKATKGIDVETTALNTNLEAADEIARQLKIRDLGGLVVIDFIDMRSNKNQREVENRMRDAADTDRARVQIGKISKFGLLEMSRQRLRSSISDSSQITCPTCGGHGFIRSMESLVISIIRLTEEEMIKPKTGRVIIQAPVDTTNKILNEKRTELSEMEARHGVQVSVISNDNLSFPDFHVQRLNTNESHISIDSIKLVKTEDCHKAVSLDPPAPTQESPALRMVKPNTQAPKRSIGLMISSWFKTLFAKPSKKGKNPQKKPYKKNNQKNNNRKPNTRNQSSNAQANKGPAAKPQGRNNRNNKNQGQKNNNQKPQGQGKKQAVKQNPGKQANQQSSPNQAKKNPNQNNKPVHNNNNKDNQAPQKPQQGKQGNDNANNKTNKGGKSIYGNKNKKRNNKPAEAPSQNQETDANTVKKMTRPLGSVAELAAKKDPVVPSGAMKKRPIDNINVDEKINGGANNNTEANSNPSQKANDEHNAKPKPRKGNNRKPKNTSPEQNDSAAVDNKAVESQSDEGQSTGTKQEAPKKAPAKKKPAKQVASKQTPAKKTAAKQAAPLQAAPQQAAPQQAASKQAAPKPEAPKQAEPKQAAPKPEAPKQAEPKQAAPKQTAPNPAEPKQATPKQTTPKPDAPKQDMPKPDAPKQAEVKPVETKQAEPNNKAPATKSAITAEMVKPGIYKAKKKD